MSRGKILFTGGNGFIGRQIIPLLEKDGWEVIKPGSNEVRFEITSQVDSLVEGEKYDAIIHAAIIGGNRLVKDDPEVFYNNIKIFENIFRHISKTNMFINLDSGASYGRPFIIETPSPSDFGSTVPTDEYGFSKYCIAKRVLSDPKGVNLRIFGCFGPKEESRRFFHTNINNYINKSSITIFEDRKMDFIYANDFYKIVKYYLESNLEVSTKDVNCVYNQKYYLSDYANMINNLSDYKVDVLKLGQQNEFSYCGFPNDLPIDYEGLEKGIRDCYDYFK